MKVLISNSYSSNGPHICVTANHYKALDFYLTDHYDPRSVLYVLKSGCLFSPYFTIYCWEIGECYIPHLLEYPIIETDRMDNSFRKKLVVKKGSIVIWLFYVELNLYCSFITLPRKCKVSTRWRCLLFSYVVFHISLLYCMKRL